MGGNSFAKAMFQTIRNVPVHFADATTLSAKLGAVVSAVNTDAAGTAVTFTDGADSYLFVVGDATAGIQSGDALIKLTGVAATGLTINGGGDITAFS